jgi:hypothetical protein
MFQSSKSILPIQNSELSNESESSGYNWKTLTKAGFVFATTTGAFLALKATGSFNLISSWLKSSLFENDSSESSALANLNDSPAQEVYSTSVNEDTPTLLKSEVVKYASSLHEGTWGCQVGTILGTVGAIVTKNPLVMGIGTLACWPQVEAQSSSSSSLSLVQEDFENTTLDASWEVVDFPGYGRYSLTDNPGYLRYYLEGFKGSGGWRNNYVPSGGWNPPTTLLRSFNSTNWVLETKVNYNLHYRSGTSSTGSQCPQFYLAFGNEVANYILIDRCVDYAYTANYLGIFVQNTNGIPELLWNNTDNLRAANDIDVNEWMRYTYDYKIERNEGDVSVYISFDGAPYSLIRSFTLPLLIGNTQKIILDQVIWTTANSYADWDYFHVTALDESSESSLSDQSASNETPVLINNALSIEKGGTKILDTENLSATDPDNSDPELLFTVSDLQHGEFQFVNGTTIAEFTQQEVTARNIQFVHDDTNVAPIYKVSVSDGLLNTPPAYASVTFASGYEPIGNEFQVNTHTNNMQVWHSVTSLSDGKFVVVYESDLNGWYTADVRGQMYHNNGTRYGTEFMVNTWTVEGQGQPYVADLRDGKFVVVFATSFSASDPADIYGQIYYYNGTRYGTEFQVSTTIPTDYCQVGPRGASLSDGKFVATWVNTYNPPYQDGSGDGVFAQMFYNNGTRYGNEFQVNTYTNDNQNSPSIASLNDGKFVIVWHSYVQDGSSCGVYGQIYNNNGTLYGGEFQINTFTSGGQGSPFVKDLSNGKFIVAWGSDADGAQDGDGSGVYSQMYNNDGTRYGNEFQVNAYTNGDQGQPFIADLSNERFLATWTSDNQDGNSYGIFGQVFNYDETRYGSEFQINTYTYDWQTLSRAAKLIDGKFAVIWMSGYWGRGHQDGSDCGIFGQMFGEDVAPTLVNNAMTLNNGQSIVLTGSEMNATDPDNDDTTLILNISNLSGGTFELETSPCNWTVTTQFIQQQIADAKIRFVDDGDEIAPSYEVSVSDGNLSTSPIPASIIFTPAGKSSISSLTSSSKISSSSPAFASSPIVSSSIVSPILSSSHQTDSVSSSSVIDSSTSSTRSIISESSSEPSASSSSTKSSDFPSSSNLVSSTTSSSYKTDSVSSSKVEDSSFSSAESITSKPSSSLSADSPSGKSSTFFSSSSHQIHSSASNKTVNSSSIFSSDTDSNTTSSLGLEDSSEKSSNEPTMPAWASALIGTVTPGAIITLGLFAIRMYFKKQKTDGVRIDKFKEKHQITADLLETMQCSLLTEASKKFTDFVEREDGLIDKLRSKEINYRSLPQREKKLVMQFAKEAIRDITPKPNLYQVFAHKTITPDDVLALDNQLENIANKIAANLYASRTEIVNIEHKLNNM